MGEAALGEGALGLPRSPPARGDDGREQKDLGEPDRGEHRGEPLGEARGDALGDPLGEALGDALGEARGDALGEQRGEGDPIRKL